MVHDHIKYASAYFTLSPGIRTALEFLQGADLEALTPGRHDIAGDAVFALVSDYDTRRPDEAFWEAHRRHVDVQFVHRGRERIGYGDLAAFDCDPYDEARDLIVARGESRDGVDVGPGEFVILFPHDVHMPGLVVGQVEAVRKVVVKVRLG
ncbi:MAG: YhcH/YjgK/YiaL family protein [Acidobacteria bacterium]|nr:YhcH/YjgK/YiaL family protein [Acidobacteriota bacterium]